MEGYTAYVLDNASRDLILQKFPPKYPKVIAHHVTVQFGVPKTTPAPQPAVVRVVGYADSGDGLEALVVSVNGTYDRPDGSIYHITLSLDPSKYSAKDSKTLLSRKTFTLTLPTTIDTIDTNPVTL